MAEFVEQIEVLLRLNSATFENRLDALLKKIGNLKGIPIKVDESELTRLNAHLTQKQAHIQQVVNFTNSNPITVRSDITGLNNISTSVNDVITDLNNLNTFATITPSVSTSQIMAANAATAMLGVNLNTVNTAPAAAPQVDSTQINNAVTLSQELLNNFSDILNNPTLAPAVNASHITNLRSIAQGLRNHLSVIAHSPALDPQVVTTQIEEATARVQELIEQLSTPALQAERTPRINIEQINLARDGVIGTLNRLDELNQRPPTTPRVNSAQIRDARDLADQLRTALNNITNLPTVVPSVNREEVQAAHVSTIALRNQLAFINNTNFRVNIDSAEAILGLTAVSALRQQAAVPMVIDLDADIGNLVNLGIFLADLRTIAQNNPIEIPLEIGELPAQEVLLEVQQQLNTNPVNIPAQIITPDAEATKNEIQNTFNSTAPINIPTSLAMPNVSELITNIQNQVDQTPIKVSAETGVKVAEKVAAGGVSTSTPSSVKKPLPLEMDIEALLDATKISDIAISGGIEKAANEAGKTIKEMNKELDEAINNLNKKFRGIRKAATEIKNVAKISDLAAFTQIETIQQSAKELLNALQSAIDELPKGTAGTSPLVAIKAKLKKALSDTESAERRLMRAASDSPIEAIAALGAEFTKKAQVVKNPSVPPEFRAAAAKAIVNATEEANEVREQIFSEIVGRPDVFKPEAIDLVRKQSGAARGQITKATKAALAFLADPANEAAAKNAGSKIVEGVEAGLNSRISKVKIIAKNVADGVTDTFKNILKIQSPSLVFKVIGFNIIDGLQEGLKARFPNLGNFIVKKLNEELKKASRSDRFRITRAFTEQAGTVAAGLFGLKLIARLRQFLPLLVQTTVEITRLEVGLRSLGKSQKQIDEFRDRTISLGQSFLEIGRAYRNFVSVVRNTSLSNQTDKIFQDLQVGFKGLEITTIDQERAIRALTQTINKGALQSEELKQQLGEVLPDAVGVSARAFGLANEEFLKLVRSGDVIAEDFVPKFARQFRIETTLQFKALKDSVVTSLDSIKASGQLAAGQLGGFFLDDPLTGITLKIVSVTFRELAKNIQLAIPGLITFGVLFTGSVVKSIATFLETTKTGELILKFFTKQLRLLGITSIDASTGMTLLKTSVIAASKAFLVLLKTFAIFALKALVVVIAFQALRKAFILLVGSSKTLKDNIKAVNKELTLLNRQIDLLANKKVEVPIQELTGNFAVDQFRAFGTSLERIITRVQNSEGVFKVLGQEIFNFFATLQGSRDVAVNFSKLDDLLENVAESNKKLSNRFTAEFLEDTSDKVKDLRRQIEDLKITQVLKGREGDTKAVTEIIAQIRELRQIETDFLQKEFPDIEILEGTLVGLRQTKKEFETFRASLLSIGRDLSLNELIKLEALDQAIKESEAQIQKYKDAVEGLDNTYFNLSLTVNKVRQDLADLNNKLELNTQQSINDLKALALSLDRTFDKFRTTGLDIRIQQFEKLKVSDELTAVSSSIQQLKTELSQVSGKDQANIIRLLGQTGETLLELVEKNAISPQGIDIAVESFAQDEKLIRGGTKRTLDALKVLLEQREQEIKLQGDLLDIEIAVAKADEERLEKGKALSKNIQNALKSRADAALDFDRDIQDFLEETREQARELQKSARDLDNNLSRQLIELQRDLKQVETEIVDQQLANTLNELIGTDTESFGAEIAQAFTDIFDTFNDLELERADLNLAQLDIEEQNFELVEQINELKKQELEFERDRIEGLRELQDKQRQFQNDQQEIWLNILDEAKDLEDELQAIGSNFEQLRKALDARNLSVQESTSQLADRLQGFTGNTDQIRAVGTDPFKTLADRLDAGLTGLDKQYREVTKEQTELLKKIDTGIGINTDMSVKVQEKAIQIIPNLVSRHGQIISKEANQKLNEIVARNIAKERSRQTIIPGLEKFMDFATRTSPFQVEPVGIKNGQITTLTPEDVAQAAGQTVENIKKQLEDEQINIQIDFQKLEEKAQKIIDTRQQLQERQVQLLDEKARGAQIEAANKLAELTEKIKESAGEIAQNIKAQEISGRRILEDGKGFLTVTEQVNRAREDAEKQILDEIRAQEQNIALIEEKIAKLPEIQAAILERAEIDKLNPDQVAELFQVAEEEAKKLSDLIKEDSPLLAQLERLKNNKNSIADAAELRVLEELGERARQFELNIEVNKLQRGLDSGDTNPIAAIFDRQKLAAIDLKEKFRALREELELLNEMEVFFGREEDFILLNEALNNLELAEFQDAMIANNVLAQEFQGALEGIFTNSLSVVDAFRQMGINLAKLAAQWAAIQVTRGIFGNLLGGIFGGGGQVQALRGGGMVENFASGGNSLLTASDISPFSLMLGDAVSKAMMAEGTNAVPIVVERGEQILSQRNGDAQLFRQLQRNGIWRELKRNSQASNFASGGEVGQTINPVMDLGSTANNRRASKTVNFTQNFNINTPDPNSFRASQKQVMLESELAARRNLERSGN